jgi:hypothetical protein
MPPRNKPASARSKVQGKTPGKTALHKRGRVKAPGSQSSRDKVRAHRARQRAKGMRPITIWVPDTRSPRFVAQARKQCIAVNTSRHAAEDRRWADAMQGFSD